MVQHWRRLVATVEREQFKGGVVVHADIQRCFPSLGRDRLIPVLTDAGADPHAVRLLDSLMQHWQQHRCGGVPFTLASWPCVKLCLQPVDRRLQAAGIRALRMGDDYRLLCRSLAEAHSALDELANALQAVGLTLSRQKSWFEHWGDRGDARQRQQRIWHGRLKLGLVRPLLTESLRFAWLRSISLPLLKWSGTPCEVMTLRDDSDAALRLK
jgi:hypothetical protein